MKNTNHRARTTLTLIAVACAVLTLLAVRRPDSATTSSAGGQSKPKKLRDLAKERDVEFEGSSGCHLADISLPDLTGSASAVIYGRIIDSNAFFEPGLPVEEGEVITTEYSVEVLQVLKNRTSETMPPPDKAPPGPLTTPLKIARYGGTVLVNGHRASLKVQGYDELKPGSRYVFFLNWSPDYRAYTLTACIFGAVIVVNDQTLKSPGLSKELQSQLRQMTLQDLFARIQ